jgi:hypothetical protein
MKRAYRIPWLWVFNPVYNLWYIFLFGEVGLAPFSFECPIVLEFRKLIVVLLLPVNTQST